ASSIATWGRAAADVERSNGSLIRRPFPDDYRWGLCRRQHPAAGRQGSVIRDRCRYDDECQLAEPGIGDRMPAAGGNEDHVIPADDALLAVDLHQAFPFEDVVDLLLDLVDMALDIGHRRIGRDSIVQQLRARGGWGDQRLRQGSAEMGGKLLPRLFGDIADDALAGSHVALSLFRRVAMRNRMRVPSAQ